MSKDVLFQVFRKAQKKQVLDEEFISFLETIFPDEITRVYNQYGKKGDTVSIPYRCLIPKKVTNLLMAGRCISVSHDMLDLVREIPCCMATGEAAGLAASLAIKTNKKSTDIDFKKLRNCIKNKS